MAEQNEKDFGLEEGMKVELLSDGDIFLLSGIIDKIEEDAIRIVNASGDDMPTIIHNSRVRIKGFRRDNSIIILHGSICGNSNAFWKIDQLSQFSFINKRDDYRHPLTIETTVNRLVAVLDDNGNETYYPAPPEVTCTIRNISGGGLLFSCMTPFEPDDHLLFAPITLSPGETPYEFRVQILRVSKNEAGQFFYGCRFFGMDNRTKQRLIQQIFKLQAETIRKRNRL